MGIWLFHEKQLHRCGSGSDSTAPGQGQADNSSAPLISPKCTDSLVKTRGMADWEFQLLEFVLFLFRALILQREKMATFKKSETQAGGVCQAPKQES